MKLQGAKDGVPFTKDDPRINRDGAPKKKDIIDEIAALMEGDGFTVIEGELLDDAGNRTGQKVKIRASVPNMKSAARAYATNMKKGDVATLKLFLDRTQGRVPEDHRHKFTMNTDNLTVEQLRTLTELLALTEVPNENG
jgi:hypothetical protein